MTDPLARARGYEDRPETAWKPAPGDVIGGTVAALDVRSTEYDDAVPVVILETAEGDRVAVWALWTVLRQELAKVRPQIGETIAVRRLDDAPSGGYRRFRVFTDRDDDDAFDWGSVETDAGDVDPNLHPEQTPDDMSFSAEGLSSDDGLPF